MQRSTARVEIDVLKQQIDELKQLTLSRLSEDKHSEADEDQRGNWCKEVGEPRTSNSRKEDAMRQAERRIQEMPHDQ
jgi:hypothetical protein